MSLFGAVTILIFLTVIAFWKPIAPLFMLMAGVSLILGLYWFDVFTTEIGMAVSLALIGYALVCMGYAFTVAFLGGSENGE